MPWQDRFMAHDWRKDMTIPLTLKRPALRLPQLRRIRLWRRNSATRDALARLSPHQLRDIGLTVEAARREAARPFWQD